MLKVLSALLVNFQASSWKHLFAFSVVTPFLLAGLPFSIYYGIPYLLLLEELSERRENMQAAEEFPEMPPATPAIEIDDFFEGASRLFVGAVIEKLAVLREQRKSHHCIVPQGALHYLPHSSSKSRRQAFGR